MGILLIMFMRVSLHCMQGVSINTFDLKNDMYPIIYGGDAPNITGGFNGSVSR